MEHETLCLLKTVADETRIRILRALYEKDCYVELLSERLNLSAATVSFHMKKLQQAGLVDSRREQYYTIYSVRRDIFRHTLEELILEKDGGETAEALREEQYRRKVLKSFMPNGICEQMPAQLKTDPCRLLHGPAGIYRNGMDAAKQRYLHCESASG